eukprot:988941-Prymnesium_polylepis.2
MAPIVDGGDEHTHGAHEAAVAVVVCCSYDTCEAEEAHVKYPFTELRRQDEPRSTLRICHAGTKFGD